MQEETEEAQRDLLRHRDSWIKWREERKERKGVMRSLILYPEWGLPLDTRGAAEEHEERQKKANPDCSQAANTKDWIKYTQMYYCFIVIVYTGKQKKDLYANVTDYYFPVLCNFPHLN